MDFLDITPEYIKALFSRHAPFVEVKDIDFGDDEVIYVTIETLSLDGEIGKEHRKRLEQGYDAIARELNAEWDYHHADLKQIKFNLR